MVIKVTPVTICTRLSRGDLGRGESQASPYARVQGCYRWWGALHEYLVDVAGQRGRLTTLTDLTCWLLNESLRLWH